MAWYGEAYLATGKKLRNADERSEQECERKVNKQEGDGVTEEAINLKASRPRASNKKCLLEMRPTSPRREKKDKTTSSCRENERAPVM